MFKKTISALLGLAACAALSSAANADSINFGQWGGEFTNLDQVTTGVTTDGVPFTMVLPTATQAQIRIQGSSWSGQFPTGNPVLFVQDPGPLDFIFQGIVTNLTGFGLEDNFFGPYTATLTAYDFPGIPNGVVLGSSSYSSDSEFAPGTQPSFSITTVIPMFEISLTSTNDGIGYGVGNTAVGAVPEPSTWAMMILGFLGVGFVTYRRRSAQPLQIASVA